MSTETRTSTTAETATGITRIAAAVDNLQHGRDAACLAEALTAAVGGDCMLIAIEPDLSLVMPILDTLGMRKQNEKLLAHLRDKHAPGARTEVDCDWSIPHGIERVMRREHRQLLAVGSEHDTPEGQVGIGRITRQLIHDLPCPIAIATEGLSARDGFPFRRIGVGFDGGAHSQLALALASQLAAGSGAELIVRGVVDDRLPPLAWSANWLDLMLDEWEVGIKERVIDLEHQIADALRDLPADTTGQVTRGDAAESLIALSSEVDLIVIGSRRWGAVARLLLGGTGEALARTSKASLLVVPAPGTA